MARSWVVHLVVVVFAVFDTLVQASYYLDDRNNSITYNGTWFNYPGLNFLNETKLYNGTLTFGGLDPRGPMYITFNGTGITLYAVRVALRMSFNVSIDGGNMTSHYFDLVDGCCTLTSQPLYNQTVYSITSLPLGNHELVLLVLPGFFIYFDYALVDTKPTASLDPSSNVHPSISGVNPSVKPTSRSVIGPAVGGTVGGIIAISTAILFILFCRRRRTRRATIDPDANILYNVHHISSMITDPDPNIMVDRTPIVGASHRPSSEGTTSTLPSGSRLNVVEQPSQSHTSSTVPIAPGPSSVSNSALAAQEARFLRHLYDRGAPAEEIAELMQAMQAREEKKDANTAGMAIPTGHAKY